MCSKREAWWIWLLFCFVCFACSFGCGCSLVGLGLFICFGLCFLFHRWLSSFCVDVFYALYKSFDWRLGWFIHEALVLEARWPLNPALVGKSWNCASAGWPFVFVWWSWWWRWWRWGIWNTHGDDPSHKFSVLTGGGLITDPVISWKNRRFRLYETHILQGVLYVPCAAFFHITPNCCQKNDEVWGHMKWMVPKHH